MNDQIPSSASRRKRVVIFEPETGGHQWYYVRYLLSAMLQQDWGFDAHFVLHPELADRMLRHTAGAPSTAIPRANALTSADVAAATCKPLWLRAFRRWNLVKRYVRQTEASHWHFMSVDEMQVPLALGERLPQGVTVSGVLFRPSVHYTHYGQKPRARERLRDLRKLLAYRRMLMHPSVVALFSLDPLFPEYARARFRSGSKVVYLPDPIPTTDVVGPINDQHEATTSAPPGRARFLMFGALQGRKGVLQTLEAIRRMPADACARMAVLFVGRQESGVRVEVENRMAALAESQPSLWIRAVDRFVEDRELAGLLSWCDIVLAPYQRVVGSSGVLVWAAASRRPVLTQDYGLVGMLTSKYGLGMTTDSTDPGQLAAALTRLARDPREAALSESGCEQFMQGRSPADFGRTILESIRSGLRATGQ